MFTFYFNFNLSSFFVCFALFSSQQSRKYILYFSLSLSLFTAYPLSLYIFTFTFNGLGNVLSHSILSENQTGVFPFLCRGNMMLRRRGKKTGVNISLPWQQARPLHSRSPFPVLAGISAVNPFLQSLLDIT